MKEKTKWFRILRQLKNQRKMVITRSFYAILLVSLFLSVSSVAGTWISSVKEIETHAIERAESVEAAFQKSMLSQLTAEQSDLERPEYQEIKNSLIGIARADSGIRFTYIYIERDNKIFFLADSEPVDSQDYSPPGQEYPEADADTFSPFRTGKTILTGPTTDRWGTWVSALVPMREPGTNKVIAVLGIDYPADSWYDGAIKRTLATAFLALFIEILLIGVYLLYRLYSQLFDEKKKQSELNEKLRESERSKSVLLDNLPGMAYRCHYDSAWTMYFVSQGCLELTGYQSQDLLNNCELSFVDLILPEYRQTLWDEWQNAIERKATFRQVYKIITREGKRKWVLEIGQAVLDEKEQVAALEGIIIDISRQKEREERIQYISEHDTLTGLFNRKYYEESLQKLDCRASFPLSLLFVDIDGVRIINDALGYQEGDRLIIETAQILQSIARPSDILARTGGDEFAFLLPNTDEEELKILLNQMKLICHHYNNDISHRNYEISLSFGYAIKVNESEKIEDIIKTSDDFMRNRKLLNRKSIHSNIIASIMSTVYEKSQETEEHARRIVFFSRMIGERLGLSHKQQDELELFSMLHDIGKVAVSDHILNKPGKLDEAEWNIMKKHPEIGYRIAKSTYELESIAEYILTHHERWDGTGYPDGLRGEEIPLLSRILAVADAYDAMTEDRVYRPALSRAEALEEIRKNSGLQFDPQISYIFINLMEQDQFG